MSLSRSRTVSVVAWTLTLLLTAGLFTPVGAADSPEEAVHEVLDDAAAIFVEQMSSDGVEVSVDELQVEVRDRRLEMVSNDGETAVIKVTATIETSLPGDQVEDVVRAMLGAGRDADDPVTDEEMQFGMAVMAGVLNGTNPVDEEVTVALEDGEWVLKSGFGIGDEADDGFEPTVSTEGLCGFAIPAELDALSELDYDSSNGFANFCSYSNSDWDDYHTTSVQLELNEEAEQIAGVYSADQAVEVAGAPAFASDADSFGTNLITQIGDDVLIVSVTMPERAPEGLDWLSQARLVTELFMPRVPDARLELAEPTPLPTPEPTPEISLCESLPLAEMNELTGLGFDEASGDSTYCGYNSLDGEPGFHVLTVSLVDLPLADYSTFLPDLEETVVGDLPAATMSGTLLVELPGGSHTLQVGGFVDEGDDAATMKTDELLRLVAEQLAPVVEVPEPPPGFGDEFPEDPALTLAEIDVAELPRPMCDYLDIVAVNALGILELDSEGSFFEEHCWLSSSDFSQGFAEVSVMLDGIPLESVRDWYVDGGDLTVAGRPAFAGGSDLRVETEFGSLALTALLPDAAVQAGHQPTDVSIPVAEMVIAAIEADMNGE